MITFAKVQLSTLRTHTPAAIIDPLHGRFTHVAINGADAETHRFHDLVSLAHHAGLQVLWWACPGYWNVLGLPQRLSIKAAWPEAPRDWPHFGLEEVQVRTHQYIADFANHNIFDGVLLDYIRYPWGPVRQKPDLFTTRDITTTVQYIRDALEPAKIIVANVGVDHEPVGQDWPTWLSENLIHSVNVRCYAPPEDLETLIARIPVHDPTRVGICLAPGGTQRFDPLTHPQFTEELAIAAYYDFPHVSCFDWAKATQGDYWKLFPRIPQPIAPVFNASVEATFWDDGSITFKWETLA